MAKITVIKEQGRIVYWTREQVGCDTGDLLAGEPQWAAGRDHRCGSGRGGGRCSELDPNCSRRFRLC